jgi:hypothetical protein
MYAEANIVLNTTRMIPDKDAEIAEAVLFYIQQLRYEEVYAYRIFLHTYLKQDKSRTVFNIPTEKRYCIWKDLLNPYLWEEYFIPDNIREEMQLHLALKEI